MINLQRRAILIRWLLAIGILSPATACWRKRYITKHNKKKTRQLIFLLLLLLSLLFSLFLLLFLLFLTGWDIDSTPSLRRVSGAGAHDTLS